jgi:hypothetical protein
MENSLCLLCHYPTQISSMLVFSGHNNKIKWAWWLKQHKLIFSQFWRLEVHDWGVGQSYFWRGLSSWFLNSCILTTFYTYAQERKCELSVDTNSFKSGIPPLQSPCIWITPGRVSTPNYCHTEVWHQHMNLWRRGTNIPSITPSIEW